MIQELQRRNVFRASISYLVISWAILQASDLIFPIVQIPRSLLRYILWALIGGFPIWVTFAYIFEWTPAGFKKTEDVDPAISVHEKTGKRLNLFIIGGMALAIVLLVADRIFHFTEVKDTPVNEKSVAVLPFENMGGAENDYFAVGVAEDILTHISRIGDVRVLSSFTLRDYDPTGKTVEQIGKELGVRFLLTGSVRKAGDKLRITCQLVQIDPEEQAWAENFDKKMDDVFAIQSEVAREVAINLKASLSPEEMASIDQKPTENLAAYSVYLKGREEYNKYGPEGMKKSIRYFKDALDIDPRFSLAWAGLADAYAQGAYQLAFLSSDYIDSALVAGQKAVDLNPQSAEAWKAMGTGYYIKGQMNEAKNKFERALDLNPNYTPAIGSLAKIYAYQGQLDKAITLRKKIIELNPLNFKSYGSLGYHYYVLGMYEEAEASLQKAIELNPNAWFSHYISAVLYSMIDQPEKATRHLSEMVAIKPDSPLFKELATEIALYFNKELAKQYCEQTIQEDGFNPQNNWTIALAKGYLLWEDGKKDSALIWLEPTLSQHLKQAKEGGEDVVTIYAIVQNYAIQGKTDKALEWMQKLIDLGYPDVKALLTDPRLKTIRKNPTFQQLIEGPKRKNTEMRLRVTASEEGMKLEASF